VTAHRDLPARHRRDVAGNCADWLRDLVIGLVDNVARSILLGSGTQMPGYVVLVSTIAPCDIRDQRIYDRVLHDAIIANLFLIRLSDARIMTVMALASFIYIPRR